jgi:hypothetical protein
LNQLSALRNKALFSESNNQSMKNKGLFPPIAWLLTLAAVFIAGRKSDLFAERSPELIQKEGPLQLRANPARITKRIASAEAKSTPLSNEDRQKVITALVDEIDPLDRANAMLKFLARLEPEDYPGAVSDFLKRGLDRSQRSEYLLLLQAWGRIAPEEALNFVDNKTSDRISRQAVIESWANYDPQAATQWFTERKRTFNDDHEWLVTGLILGIAENDPILATKTLNDLYSAGSSSAPVPIQYAFEQITPKIAQLGFEEASRWIENLPEKGRRLAMDALTDDLKKIDPDRAEEWRQSLPDAP